MPGTQYKGLFQGCSMVMPCSIMQYHVIRLEGLTAGPGKAGRHGEHTFGEETSMATA